MVLVIDLVSIFQIYGDFEIQDPGNRAEPEVPRLDSTLSYQSYTNVRSWIGIDTARGRDFLGIPSTQVFFFFFFALTFSVSA